MTLPVSGEQHDKAVLAVAMADSPDPNGHAPLDVYERQVRTYFASLAEQGVVFIEQPRCKACKGGGSDMPPGGQKMTDLVPCPRCNGTGRARMVDVHEIVEYLFETIFLDEDGDPGGLCARAVQRRFASEDTAKDA